ncbi:MAG: proprotein convertase P-domain-containing protein [Xanthomonadales bacterium]|nr:proprotein convertase P-domain-containing protein [Xanthomonadales bacterium]
MTCLVRIALAACAAFLPLLAFATPQLLELPSGGETKAPSGTPPNTPSGVFVAPDSPFGYDFSIAGEREPNDGAAQAQLLALVNDAFRLRANIYPGGDVDWYAIPLQAGDRVYAATNTTKPVASGDTVLTLLAPDGTTVIEEDDDDGGFGGVASSIAGATVPSAGTYFLRVRGFAATTTIRPYELLVQVRRGSPTPETEPNELSGGGQPLPASRWVSGAITGGSDVNDSFNFSLAAGDTVFLSLDADPQRVGGARWNPRLGLGTFDGFVLLVNDGNTTSPNSEAFFFTVEQAGSYTVFVDAAAGAGPAADYHLSVTVFPFLPASASCQTYTSADTPIAIPTGPGSITSTIAVPGTPRIADLDVALELQHDNPPDLDLVLEGPGGNRITLLTDPPTAAPNPRQFNLVLDDEAALQLGTYNRYQVYRAQPEGPNLLSWFDGMNGGGTWRLTVHDDLAMNGGTLQRWSLRICEVPAAPSCPAGTQPVTVYQSDFNADNGGFTASGTASDWQWGTPSAAPLNDCASGTSCWATRLAGNYSNNADETLQSPLFNLSGLVAPVTLSWAQKYQMESASFDRIYLRAENGAASVTRQLFAWLGPTMQEGVGNPTQTIAMAAGWGLFRSDLSPFAGDSVRLKFRLASDASGNFPGWGIDDVRIDACQPFADLAVTKTNGVSTVQAGTSTTYTIVVSHAAGAATTTATVSDAVPAAASGCTWTCSAAGGASCGAASGSGAISETVTLVPGSSVTYQFTCAIPLNATAGPLSNTVTVSGVAPDPNGANNTATDTDTIQPVADLAVTKSDGVSTVVAGTSTTYTIQVRHQGGGATVTDAVVVDNPPPSLSCTWTCSAAGGASCGAASGSGAINQTVTLPPGGSVTFSLVCAIAPSATGTIANTASVSSATVPDPVAGNNSATDTNTVQSQADLSVAIAYSNTTPPAGSTITKTVTVSNAGPSTAVNVVVNDLIPSGYTLVSATPSQGSYNPATGVWTVGTLAPSASATLTFQLQVRFSGNWNNTASASSDTPDPNGANNQSTVGVNPTGLLPPPRPIPMLGLAGLLLLGGGLLLGLAWMRRGNAA